MFQSIVRQITLINQQNRTFKNDKLITEIEDLQQATEVLFESIILKVDELDGSLRQFFVTSFFIKKGILQNDVVKNNVDYVTIIEIKDEKVVGYNINGIYSIGVYQSHSQKHILLKEKSIYKILDIKQIDIALKEVIDYSVRNNLNDNTMLFYIKKIIQIYDDNYNHKSVMINKK